MVIDEDTRCAFESALGSLDSLWNAAYDEGVSRRVELPSATLKGCIASTVARQSEKIHVVYKGRELTYRETNDWSCRLANGLAARGLRKGDAVCILLGDIPELIISYMACYKAGFIAIGLNPRSTADELAHRLSDGRVHALVMSTAVCGMACNGIEKSGVVPEVAITVDNDAGAKVASEAPESLCALEELCDVVSWDAFLDASENEEPDASVSPDDVAMLIYTGGTTGLPKGCPLTHRMLVWAQYFFYSFLRPRLGDARNMTSLLTSPMTHAYGMDFGVNWGVVIGGKVVIAHSLDGGTIAKLIREQHVTVWGAVPATLALLCDEVERSLEAVPSLEAVVVSCAAASSETLKRFRRLCPSVALMQDYGMTETSGPVTLTPVVKGMSAGSVGVPVENTDVLVVDLRDGKTPVPVGQRGEVVFRGPQIISAYWNAPDETAKAFQGEWIHSGDVGCFDEAGFLSIVDRIKDVIDVGGFSVFPREIDEVIHAHPLVADACTIGVPDAKSGERPKSFVVLKQGAQVSEQGIIDYCHEHLIAYKCPKYVEFIESIPLTTMGKPNKTELRRRERLRAG